MKEPKLCLDPICIEQTYVCRECSRLCCKHFCSNRSDGKATCGVCVVERREKVERGLVRCSNDNCQLVMLEALSTLIEGKEYCKTCYSQIEFDKIEHEEIKGIEIDAS